MTPRGCFLIVLRSAQGCWSRGCWRAQGELGVIPADAAAFINRMTQEVLTDPAALAAETVRNGVPVPALLAQAGATGPMQ